MYVYMYVSIFKSKVNQKFPVMKKLIQPISLMAFLLTSFLPLESLATKHTINVQNFSFSPANITNVQIGDTMRWVWISGVHTTTSSGIPAGADSWDSPITSTVTFYEYRVSVAGVYNYVCTPHVGMNMIGSFTVQAGSTLSVSPSNQNVPETAGNTTFSVISNSNWTALSNQTWCTVTPSGSGNGTITATYSANPGTTNRVAGITVSVSGLPSQTVTVTQAGAEPTLSVNPPNQDVSAEAGSTNFTVTSNSAWSAQSNALWCSVTSEGSGNSIIIADYTENTTFETRVAELVIFVENLPPQTVTVTQEASTVSVNEIQLPGFQLYPNPAKEYFYVRTNNLSAGDLELTIQKMDGSVVVEKFVFSAEDKPVDVKGFPAGTYIVSLKTGEKTHNQRLVIVN